YDLAAGRVLDHVGGLEDLEGRRIRSIGDPRERFAEDRLRMLRAVRFATTLGFSIEERTWGALLDEAPAIAEVSAERIRDELEGILVHPRRELGFYLLSDSGLMGEILPEVETMRGVEQPEQFHPEGDVHRHTALVLSHLADPSFPLALGTLLHDIGKPPTFTVADRIRFNRHDRVGADMAAEVCARLRLSRRERDEVVYLVRRHLIFMSISQMRPARRSRLFDEPHFPALLELCRADCLGSHRDTGCCDQASRLYEEYLAQGPPVEPLLRGRDLLELGIAPGPRMGKILRSVEEARRDGMLAGREQALEWVRERHLPRGAKERDPR
ncbi:MAG: HD domain-containing protein, partial [Planctomycetota bacterium]